MPRQVDHEQRRREIVEALWRVVSASGLEAVSLNEVAAAAGVSKGRVQHYFDSKQQLLDHTAQYLRTRLEQRITRQLRAAPDHTPLARLRGALRALLPVDPDARDEAVVADAFLARAVRDPATAAIYRAGQAQLVAAIADLVRAAQSGGELPADHDPAAEAETLLALTTGLAGSVLLGHHTPAAAEDLINRYLTR